MSSQLPPSKFYVPELPRQYVSDFADSSHTTEAALLRLVLDTSASPTAAVVVKGDGGTGKTTSLLGVGYEPRTWARFPDAVWFVSLGQNADPSALLEDFETVVRAVVGTSEAEDICRLSKRRNNASAATEAIQVLNDRDVLLLLDDVWADAHAVEVGRSTVFSLVQNCLRKVHKNPGRLRVVVSTRDASVARVLPGSCGLLAQPLGEIDPLAGEILCRYAEVPFDEIQRSGAQVQRSFNALLSQCRGLQIALAIAGCGVRERMELGPESIDAVWHSYANEVAEAGTWLKKTHSDHPGIYAMLQSSLEHVKVCLQKDGIALPFDLRILFSFLAVMKKQEAVPVPVLACIWRMSSEITVQLCTALARLHLISVKEVRGGVRRVSVHDLVLDFCVGVLCERPRRKEDAHDMTVQGLELMLSVGGTADIEGDGCTAFWKLCTTELDAGTRDYFVRNIARHMTASGKNNSQKLLCLVTDFRWIEARMKLGRNGADLSGILDDIQTLLMGSGKKMDAEVRIGLEMISDGAQLSMLYVANNPRELAYQLQGRLCIYGKKNRVVARLLWSVEKYAKRPWLKVGRDVLKKPGGRVVLQASLPHRLECVAVLPNGEDVVIGGGEGYLAVFSIRYASVLRRLYGHQDTVRAIAVCAETQRIFSGGADGTIRTWTLGTEQQGGNQLLRHQRQVRALAVTTDGRWIVFGDSMGQLVVCNSRSGQVRCQWHGHNGVVKSLAIREHDGIIVSGSWDGTIGRWESASGREIGNRIEVGCEMGFNFALSRDGKKIAFVGLNSVGVVDANSGDLLSETNNTGATCVTFGSDNDTVHFGNDIGLVRALSADGSISGCTNVHTSSVSAIAQSDESRLLVSVGWDGALAVQNLERFGAGLVSVWPYGCGHDPSIPLQRRVYGSPLKWIVVLPDRKRVLFSTDGYGTLNLLNLSETSAAMVNCEDSSEELSKATDIIRIDGLDAVKFTTG